MQTPILGAIGFCGEISEESLGFVLFSLAKRDYFQGTEFGN
jgi:hypothetical protein